jgi:hypothetical protein
VIDFLVSKPLPFQMQLVYRYAAGFAWVRVIDSSLSHPADCTLSYVNMAGPNGTYLVAPHAVLVLELAPAPADVPPTPKAPAAAAVEAERLAAAAAARTSAAAAAAAAAAQTTVPSDAARAAPPPPPQAAAAPPDSSGTAAPAYNPADATTQRAPAPPPQAPPPSAPPPPPAPTPPSVEPETELPADAEARKALEAAEAAMVGLHKSNSVDTIA